MNAPLVKVISTALIHARRGGPTSGKFNRLFTLDCGHTVVRTQHANIPRRMKCDQCLYTTSTTAKGR